MQLTLPRHAGGAERTRCLTGLGAITLVLALALAAGCETTNPELRNRGQAAYLTGNYERSLDFYGQAVRQDPTDVQAQFGLGRAHLSLEQPRDALLALEEARALAGDDSELRIDIFDGIAEALYQLDRHDRLHTFLRNSAARYGATADYLRQGEYLVRIGDMDGAEQAYRRGAHFAPDGEVEPFLALARFYENVNDVERAVRALRWAYYVDPNDGEVNERLRDHGWVPGPTVAEEPPRALLRPRR